MSINPRIITAAGSQEGVARSVADLKREIARLKALIGTLPPSSVTSDLIKNGAVTATALADGAVTGAAAAAARAYRAAAFTLAAGDNKIALDTIKFDSASHFDITTNHRYTCSATGIYDVQGVIQATASAANQYITSKLSLSGTFDLAGSRSTSVANGDVLSSVIAGQVSCAVGDYLELWVNTASAIPIVPGSTTALLCVQQSG